eukprot:3635954-Rhodomonas_salina.2
MQNSIDSQHSTCSFSAAMSFFLLVWPQHARDVSGDTGEPASRARVAGRSLPHPSPQQSPASAPPATAPLQLSTAPLPHSAAQHTTPGAVLRKDSCRRRCRVAECEASNRAGVPGACPRAWRLSSGPRAAQHAPARSPPPPAPCPSARSTGTAPQTSSPPAAARPARPLLRHIAARGACLVCGGARHESKGGGRREE